MQKILFPWLLGMVFLTVFPNTSISQLLPPNTVTLALSPDGSGSSFSSDIGVPITLYLALVDPTDSENGNEPYSSVSAFECTLEFSPQPSALILLESVLPPLAVDTGERKDINSGYLDFIVEFQTPVEAVDRSVQLAKLVFIKTSPMDINVTLTPVPTASLPGQLVFESVMGELRPMNPYISPYGNWTFLFGSIGLPVENNSFGSVKVLYR